MVVWHLDSILSSESWEKIPKSLEYCGLFFDFISISPYLFINLLEHPDSSIRDIISEALKHKDIYFSKHLFIFLFSLIAYLGVALFTKDLLPWAFAGGGVVLLALMPRFWGHSFFNPKDIPFAALFTLVCYLGARFTNQILVQLSDFEPKGYSFFPAFVFGCLAGALTSIRIGGFVVIFFCLVVTGILCLVNKAFRDMNAKIMKLLRPFLILSFTWAVVTILFSPVSWSSPIRWFAEAVLDMSKHPWTGVTLTLGQHWWGHSTPWFYLPVWFGITIPLITLLLSMIGWLMLLGRFKSLSLLQQNIFLWLSLQVFALPLIAVLKHSTIYNGVRHFLFILPALSVFAAAGISLLLRYLPNRAWKAIFLTAVVSAYSFVAVDMIRLHPYEYIYFNQFARVPNLEKKFETDYWGLSVREATEWINRQPETGKVVFFHAPWPSIQPFVNESITLFAYKPNISPDSFKDTFYYLAYPRNKYGNIHHPQDYFPDCDIAFQVQRRLGDVTIPLTVVKRCNSRYSQAFE
jgi:hypothetical protein